MTWIATAFVAIVVIAWIVWPLYRSGGTFSRRKEGELAVYRDQLSELKIDVERGLTTEEQAALEEIAISRAMLDLDSDAGSGDTFQLSSQARWGSAISVGAVLLIGSFAIYSNMGDPNLPAKPFVSVPSQSDDHSQADMRASIIKLASRLEENPNDFEGWVLLARSYEFQQDAGNAAGAWRRAYDLKPDDSNIGGTYAEALINARGGIVPPEARRVFEKLKQSNPADPRSLFYIGLAESQAGNGQDAIDIWMSLLANSPADAPWVPAVKNRLEDTSKEFSIKVGEMRTLPPLDQQPRAPFASAPSSAVGPTAEDIEAAGEMTADEQTAMIRSMVARLAERLEGNPDDVQGWLRLARAQSVLDGPTGGTASLERALKVAKTEEARGAILATASELGVSLGQ